MGPVLRYPGAKWKMVDWIIQHLPPHRVYLEPFFGSGAVFFTKKPVDAATINDIDGEIVNLFRVIRDQPQKLALMVDMTPWAREEYVKSYEKADDPVEEARRFLVRCWQAHGSSYIYKPGWRNCIAGRDSYTPVWNQLPERILDTVTRLKSAQIENQPAVRLIRRYKDPNVLIYADPPYVVSSKDGKRRYTHEMTDEEHIKLLEALDSHPGPVLISGYENLIYDKYLADWDKECIEVVIEGGQIKKEVLWINPIAAEYNRQLSLFDVRK